MLISCLFMMMPGFSNLIVQQNPLPAVTLTRDHRGELMAQVFRPGYNLPTMTIEEAADIDLQYMIKGGG
jgi:hypothetical protein